MKRVVMKLKRVVMKWLGVDRLHQAMTQVWLTIGPEIHAHMKQIDPSWQIPSGMEWKPRADVALLEQRIRSVEIALTRVPEPEKKKSYAEINAEIMAKLEQTELTPEEIADWRAGM